MSSTRYLMLDTRFSMLVGEGFIPLRVTFWGSLKT